ncbi:prepilin-type N-terminal cleavage/methylation domain-containing protein [Tessaracoccus sp.]
MGADEKRELTGMNGPGPAMGTARRIDLLTSGRVRQMLSRTRRSTADKDQGFTLIELLVVIIIIGILAAIAIPVFLNQRKKGVDAGMKSDLRNVANAMEAHFVDKRVYPQVGLVWGAGAMGVGATAGGDFSFNNQPITLTGANVVTAVAAGAVAGTYCLTVTNPTASNSGGLSYDSDKGGLLPLGTACS